MVTATLSGDLDDLWRLGQYDARNERASFGAGTLRVPWRLEQVGWADLLSPTRAREPQWFGTEYTSRRKGEAMKGG